MFGDHFYHATLRKSVAVFGTIFNNIGIVRKKSDGSVINQVKVPLAYGPKQKFLSRLDQSTNIDASVALKLPRMAFEITSLAQDTASKLNKLSSIVESHGSDVTKKKKIAFYTNYNIGMSLYILAKNQDDGLQIVEQILPYFQPDYTVTMIENSTMDTKRDIPFILENVSYDDSYAGDLTTTRRIEYTLNFTAKIYLYGPVSTSAIIKKVSADLYTNTSDQSPSRQERVTVQPNPTSADKDDTYTYTTTLDFFDDGLNYDEGTGNDV